MKLISQPSDQANQANKANKLPMRLDKNKKPQAEKLQAKTI